MFFRRLLHCFTKELASVGAQTSLASTSLRQWFMFNAKFLSRFFAKQFQESWATSLLESVATSSHAPTLHSVASRFLLRGGLLLTPCLPYLSPAARLSSEAERG